MREAALAAAPADLRPALADAMIRAGAQAEHWSAAILITEPEAREDVAFLIAHMPTSDLAALTPAFLTDHVRRTRAVFAAAPWRDAVPREVYLNAVLPYANVNERREAWHAALADRVRPLIDGCTTTEAAALALNAKLFNLVNVQYHPSKRPKPDQSPSESIAAGYASCTGLSILLIDACRSVGVPARLVGTPEWVIRRGDANGNHGGNHTWVQIWHDGRWRTLGASEVSPLDQTWFLDNASKAITRPEAKHRIYAATWRRTGLTFPLAWNDAVDWVNAEDVTGMYAKMP